ncbi:hypothetical protein BC940DRAFT_309598 [Gongronella butleri]|nr:hypothetical protein BC940DRAFT_309598 [Gongronella butleri]
MILFVWAILVLLWSSVELSVHVAGFCFENQFDPNAENKLLTIRQVNNFGNGWPSKFECTLHPGEKSCCNYNNMDCNALGGNDAPTVFARWIHPDQEGGQIHGLSYLYMLSGGSCRHAGNPMNPRVDIWDAYGDPYVYTGPPYSGSAWDAF